MDHHLLMKKKMMMKKRDKQTKLKTTKRIKEKEEGCHNWCMQRVSHLRLLLVALKWEISTRKVRPNIALMKREMIHHFNWKRKQNRRYCLVFWKRRFWHYKTSQDMKSVKLQSLLFQRHLRQTRNPRKRRSDHGRHLLQVKSNLWKMSSTEVRIFLREDESWPLMYFCFYR